MLNDFAKPQTADPAMDAPEATSPLDIPEWTDAGNVLDPARVIREAADAKIAGLEKELADTKDNWIRAVADAQNARRRARIDVEEAYKFAIVRFAKELLSVSDNLARAIAAAPPAADLDEKTRNVLVGVEATGRELAAALERNGVRKIAAQDAVFDPQLHQAVSEVQDPSRFNNTVAQVYMDGYTISDRLLRAAMVVVAKGGPPPPAPQPESPAAETEPAA